LEHITVAQYLANTLSSNGQRIAFVLSGGAALHLIHAINDHPEMSCVPLNHELSAAAAADGFSRVAKTPAICIATSGPGATNLITGIAGAFYDSVPVIFLTGQVSRSRALATRGLRQYGFQQTPFVEIVRPISKAAFEIIDPRQVKRVLGEALWVLSENRKGPVVIDIPDDVQREVINPSELEEFTPPLQEARLERRQFSRRKVANLLARSERPVIVVGGGLEENRASQLSKISKELGAPVVRTWAASGMLDGDDPQNFGFFGTHGSRVANLVVQSADLILSIGCRLDTKATGSPPTSFARSAKKIVVDIDAAELQKFAELKLKVEVPILMDAGSFLDELATLSVVADRKESWNNHCQSLRSEVPPEDFSDFETFGPSPIYLMSSLNSLLPEETLLVLDTGLSLPFAMEYLGSNSKRKIYHDFNNTAMGWSLGASIGASYARPTADVLTILGDGSLALSLGDLSSVSGNNLKAKIVLLDNQGHGMIRQTQNQWFSRSYVASSLKGGIFYPDWKKITEAANFKYFELESNNLSTLKEFLSAKSPALLHVKLNADWEFRPQVLFGFPNEDQDPPLPRILLSKLMKIPLTDKSQVPSRGTKY
jgi:acetolactate synthase-1/2/3 large subunit